MLDTIILHIDFDPFSGRLLVPIWFKQDDNHRRYILLNIVFKGFELYENVLNVDRKI